MVAFVMGSIRSRSGNGKLFLDFHYNNKRCREQTLLDDSPANRKKLQTLLNKIEAEITLGQFEYEKYFPNSSKAEEFKESASKRISGKTPTFKNFAENWFNEMQIQWRKTHITGTRSTLDKYLIPWFGEMLIESVTKADVLEFRSSLAKVKTKKGKSLSPSRINHIITPLRMILNEAANRHEFSSPYNGIKSLKVPRTDVEPFSLEEVKRIIDNVRPDYKNYYTVRFFTGMRTGEIDGLQWQYIDFEHRQILIRQSLSNNELIYTKNDGSFRTIDMSDIVYQALCSQHTATGGLDFVFCNTQGGPLYHNNVRRRVWRPLLRHLGLRIRRPYQTRHTAATLWLAAGESPEWIARQMGHTTTEMLFRVYSRYVPNLTRQDGSAFDRLLKKHGLAKEADDESKS